MEAGRIPPQAVDIEQKVLGAMLLDASALGAGIEILNEGDFYRSVHGFIFAAMTGLFGNNEPVDITSVANELKKRRQLESVGNEIYLAELVECAVTPANAAYHANIIKEKSTLRSLINTSTDIINRCFDDVEEVEPLLDEAQSKIYDVAQGRIRNQFQSVGELLPKTFDDIERYGKGQIVGVPSGFKDLDEMTAGFQPGELIILAGRPSMGKTALALSMASNAALLSGKAVGIFSLEMSKGQLVQRLLCAQAKINMHSLRTGRLPLRDFPRLSLAAGPLNEARIVIDDTSNISVLEMRAKARRLKLQGKLDILIVDYLQLMEASKKMSSREQEISYISRSLKGLAKDLGIPVLALSQLARRVEDRQDSRPQLSDLRESGAIEQDADVVLFVYREEYYKKEDGEPGKAEIIISKQRNGPLGTANATFVHEYAGFENYSPRMAEVAF
ncbi:MAG: replicative DNA helicase [Fibrobacterota bacterium]